MVDEVRARRARIARLSATGRRVGYLLFAIATVVFALGMATTFTTLVTAAITACLALGSALLAPAIVVGYGVKAAEREDRAAGR